MNPTLQNTYLTWLNIDSQYREILDTGSNSAVKIYSSKSYRVSKKDSNTILQKDTSTDFTFSLSSPLKHVLEMSLVSIEVNLKGYHNFSEVYDNLHFEVDNGEILSIDINPGKYTSEELEKEINDKNK